ncbi:hypothetical protein LEP1GSC125_2319 [Leptospira mayottensis 200901122]|uniref:Uncharacterized protein n=1 Tax=Leptospira mayottensis 200901122 TaxID=1193010 RepID=A0AA87MRE5_9LEPT|nr:hypothetical protein LEP1GSC125_2319 [Leptospira mayottensis 200901122]
MITNDCNLERVSKLQNVGITRSYLKNTLSLLKTPIRIILRYF